jgi:nucleoside-diphosphate-sugar epimerase
VPLTGNANGWWSFLHIDDAATATAIAIERGAPAIYNIVDDEPAPVREWLPARPSWRQGFLEVLSQAA